MARVDVVCPRCGDWREDEVSEEEITASTIDCNPIAKPCPPCQKAEWEEEMLREPTHLGCCGDK
jgi:hypothetical protein